MSLRILASVSDPGGGANEDAAGAAGRFAWIVDGASGVGPRVLREGATDAAWLAGTLDRLLRTIVERDGPSLDTMIADLEAALLGRFEADLAARLPNRSDGPSACLALVEVEPLGTETRVRAAVLGDVAVFVPDDAGLQRWTDERLRPFEAETLDILGRSKRPPAGVAEPVLAQIRRNRTWLNREGGYYAVHPRLPWSRAMLRFEALIPTGRSVVLATDGYLRLCDLFGACTEAELATAVASGEADDLLARLRRLEREDHDGRLHLRVKTHDDATVLAITTSPGAS